ncbi:MAG TPA: hypothetical protein VEI98_06570 [Xanthobacteraceae bacterium]|nr:hypothetical protein [Xanthobacteraceae bacterium]
MSEDFDWGELGSDWWLTTSREIGANTKQAMFACAKHRGASNTEAARQSGYGSGSEAAVRAEGYRVFRSNTVQQLLSLAVAEAGGGYGGDITDAEARQILAKLARGSDPQVKIKALESLAKMDAVKAAAEREEGTRSPAAIIAELKLNAPFRALELGTLMGRREASPTEPQLQGMRGTARSDTRH